MTIHLRAASPRVSTINHDDRTVEAIVSTGADVQRGGFIERLDLGAVDLSRLIGAPVLDAHRSASTRDQLGVVEAAEVRPEGLWVRLRFRSNEAAKAVLADIGDGTLRGLSIGYSVAEWNETREGATRIRTATRWTPVEVSIVPVPADTGAHFRNGDPFMPNDQTTVETRAAVNVEIRSIAQTAGLTREWADEQIDAGATADTARAAAFTAMQQRSAQTQTRTTQVEITVDHTDPAVIATRAGEALYARSHPEHELSAPARQYAYMTIPDLARESLRRSGVSVLGLAPEAVLTRALHSTSDFPLIMGDAVNREMRAGYIAAPSGVRPLAKQSTAPDFRAKRKLTLGDAPKLEQVPEGGAFKHGTIDESGESYSIATYGKIFGITRQAMVNDDLGAFNDVSRKMGIAARAFENDFLVSMVMANPAMSDGVAVFHADHGNLTATAADPSITSLSAARLAMRKMKGLGGLLIDVTPRYVLVPPELETVAEQVLTEIAAAKTEDVNPFGKLSLLVEPRLTVANRWYVVADPANAEGLEYAYLEGAPGPQIETRAGFEVDGVQTRVRLDFGAGWTDHRAWHRVG
jgi:HK97 family phage prohead protease